MRHSPLLTLCFFVATLLPPIAASAAGASINVSLVSDINAIGTWTLTYPSNESIAHTETSLALEGVSIGHYTLFAGSPSGTMASITMTKSGSEPETLQQSQMSFDLAEGDSVSFVVHYHLVNFGTVGVNSMPPGIPFDVRGPDNLVKSGVTPITLEKLPVGNYSVQYRPTGCTFPAPKSDVLKKDATVYFSIDINCDTLETVKSDEATHISAEVKGNIVKFTDVPVEAWFAPFVSTVSRKGILTGYRTATGESTGTFGPENPVTVAELAKITHVMADIDETDVSGSPRNESALGKWFTKYVSSAEQRGWLLYQDPKLDLIRPATRGEVLITLLQVLDIPLQWGKGKMFQDVTLTTPYANAIETASAAGIVSGATDEQGNATGLFHPDAPITRAEMAKILIIIQEKYQQRKSADEEDATQ